MAGRELDDDVLKDTVKAYLAADKVISEAARCLDVNRKTVRRRIRKAVVRGLLEPKDLIDADGRIEERIEKAFGEQDGMVTTVSLKIRTVEQALEAAEVDLDEWEPTGQKVNFWTVTMGGNKSGSGKAETFTNYQVTVKLKRRVPDVTAESVRALIEEMPRIRPRKPRRQARKTGFALEMAPFDAHVGKLAWRQETGQFDYDLKIARKMLIDGVEENLNLAAGFGYEKVYFVLGQDVLHSENFKAVTPGAGNVLDVDSRLPKIYKTGKGAIIESILMCREVAPVEVVWVPGNHDMHASMFLADVVAERFRDDPHVTVDDSPNWRKARLWGTLLIGWAHDAFGRKAQATVNLLAQYWPELWGPSVFREWHVGHKHKKQEQKFMPVLTSGGVIVRQIPALSPIDAWHAEEVFTDAVPACESLVWSKEAGVPAHFTSNVRVAA